MIGIESIVLGCCWLWSISYSTHPLWRPHKTKVFLNYVTLWLGVGVWSIWVYRSASWVFIDNSSDGVVRMQWLRGRASDSRLREPRFESCAAVLKLGHVFHLRSWVLGYRQWWIFVQAAFMHYLQHEQFCQGVTCKALPKVQRIGYSAT